MWLKLSVSSLMPWSQRGYNSLSGHNDCLVLMALCLYWPFLKKPRVPVPEMPWGWGKTATFNKAVGNPWMQRLQECNSSGDLFRSRKESEEFFLTNVAEKQHIYIYHANHRSVCIWLRVCTQASTHTHKNLNTHICVVKIKIYAIILLYTIRTHAQTE